MAVLAALMGPAHATLHTSKEINVQSPHANQKHCKLKKKENPIPPFRSNSAWHFRPSCHLSSSQRKAAPAAPSGEEPRRLPEHVTSAWTQLHPEVPGYSYSCVCVLTHTLPTHVCPTMCHEKVSREQVDKTKTGKASISPSSMCVSVCACVCVYTSILEHKLVVS